jgi:hunchback-like protein
MDLEEAEVRAPRVNSQGKVKQFKCKQCEFVAVTKLEFWRHGRGHIKPEKLLFCPKCIFVTEYKHHLEYHLRNHYGTKPFKCTHCNYSCVNKSMLNSHMKSHNNVYQYRCADCTYATKYCHSLKLHLKKYQHKPAMVLNQDGTSNPLPMLDVFGNKRAPKGKKGARAEEEQLMMPPSILPQFGGGFPTFPGGLPPGLMQMVMQQQLAAGGGPKGPPPSYRPQERERGVSPPSMMPDQLRCDKCEFVTSSVEVHKNHMVLHASSERSTLHQLLSSSPLQSKPREESPFPPALASPRPQPYHRPPHPFMDRPVSPPSQPAAGPNPFLPNFPGFNPFLQGLVPNPAIQALMEERRKKDREARDGIPSSPDSIASPGRKEEAPLPPNKRLKPDFFQNLYNQRMMASEQKSGQPSPPLSNVLDLSKESGDGPVGGGSHGSSSGDDSASAGNRSKSSSPSLTSSGTKNRRKGKAFKIVQQHEDQSNSEEEGSASPATMPTLMPVSRPAAMSEQLMCNFCGISFQNTMMHKIHMGYHGFDDPFKCNQCGDESTDALNFFLHIARKEHNC